MYTYTFTLKPSGQKFSIKAKKDRAERLATQIADVLHAARYHRELRGTVGVSESSTVLMSIGMTHTVADPDGYEQDKAAFLAALPAAMDEAQAEEQARLAWQIVQKHMAVNDCRTTPEQDAEREAERQRIAAEQNAKYQTWLDAHAEPGGTVANASGKRPILLRHTFNNSDMMSDYHDPFCPTPYSKPLLLAWVDDGAPITESLIRGIIARYPSLSGLTWTWHGKQYRGDSSYMVSDEQGRVHIGHRCENDERPWCYQIETGYSRNASEDGFHAAIGFNAAAVAAPALPASGDGATVTGSRATVARNAEHDGVEVRFAEKPDEQTLADMKAHGFRWSFKQRIWYAKYTDERYQWAARFTL